MKYNNCILFIPEKFDKERQEVFETWISLGGIGIRIGKFWEKPDYDKNKRVAIYGNDTFALVLAQVLNVNLISVDDTLISKLHQEWTKRKIIITSLNKIDSNIFPIFIKPVIPKQFKAKVYKDLTEFSLATKDISEHEKVIISEIILIECESRSFVFQNKILDSSIYEGNGEITDANNFLSKFIESNSSELPETFVIDLGFNQLIGWFVIEFNSSWAAGLNNCKAERIIDSIANATIN